MVFILTGMHRSGTSMFARFMNESGINMGSDFYFDDTSNKYGHFEDLDFLNLQRNELSHHFNEDDWLIYEKFIPSNDFDQKAGDLFKNKTERNRTGHWGWKDPRTTLFLDYWHKLNPEIRFIFLVREPEAVVNSLCKLLKTRWSITEKTKYLKTYIHYNQEILNFCKRNNRSKYIVVEHEQLIENPRNVIPKINAATGFSFDAELFERLCDKNVISPRQFIPFIFHEHLLSDSRKAYQRLVNIFNSFAE